MASDLVERLRSLHVWPQSTADTWADIIPPKHIDGLYSVGKTAHEAADTIEAQAAEIERLWKAWEAKHAEQVKDRKEAELWFTKAQEWKAEIERLREDKARLDWLESEMNDVRWLSGAGTEACSPSDEVILRIVSHHMAEPAERVEAENWNENLRAAIDEGRAALAKEPGHD